MSDFAYIKNKKELQEEKGIYYPYLMQILGAYVVDGSLIPETFIKRFPAEYVEGLFQDLLGIIRKSDSSKIFPVIERETFKYSVEWAMADLFNDGCDFEDVGDLWERSFKFMDKEEYQEFLVDKC